MMQVQGSHEHLIEYYQQRLSEEIHRVGVLTSALRLAQEQIPASSDDKPAKVAKK